VSRAIEGTLLPVAATKTTSGFEVDLREIVPVLDALALEGLPPPFLKRYRLEGAAIACDGHCSWARVRRSTCRTRGCAPRMLSFTPGAYRYLRVTWDDTNSARVACPRPRVA
jgi:hypothetical protein